MPDLDDITIRTDLRVGDLGTLVQLHGLIYGREFGYNIYFETVVAKSVHEFFELYDPARSRVWMCEHGGSLVGTLALLDRGDQAQLRYFLLMPEYRGIGLGGKLMRLFMDFYHEIGYSGAYLLTTDDLGDAAKLYKRHGFQLASEYDSDQYGKMHKRQRYELKSE